MRAKRDTEGMNLAFLDIMSCGLGAVILIFMLVKQHLDRAPSESAQDLGSELESLEQQKQEMELSIQQMIAENSSRQRQIDSQLKELSEQARLLKQKSQKLDDTNKKQAQLQRETLQKIKESQTKRTDDKVKLKGQGEEEYLIGIKMEGSKILIMLDSSGSMTADKLADVIRYKIGSDSAKKASPKWKRALRTVKWLLARLPSGSQFALASYAEDSKILAPGKWASSADQGALGKALDDLSKIVPKGATNLEAGLEKAASLSPDSLYLITDGLPTVANGYRGIGNCRSIFGKKTISGECRIAVFRNSITSIRLAGTRINAILYPIEGDPQSSFEYWNWTGATGGLLIQPSPGWP